MHRLLPLSLLLAGLIGSHSLAADAPRDPIEKAIAAQGGIDKLGRTFTTVSRIKGAVFFPVEGLTFTGTFISQSSDQRKSTIEVDVGGNRLTVTQVRDGKRGWKSTGGIVEDLTDEVLKDQDRAAYIDRVIELTALLSDESFTLEALGEDKVDGQPVVAVKVKAEGQPDVSLFFSKDTRLLVKYAHRDKHPTTNQDALHETLLSDYREPQFSAADEEALKAAKVAVDGPGLLEFLRKRTPQKADEDKIKALIKQLGDEVFAVREKATTDLVDRGSAAVPLLREAAKSTDPEIARRAATCLEMIGDRVGRGPLALAAIRLVGLKKPEGAAAVLLDFAARAGDDETAREARSALMAVAVRDGQPAPAVVEALQDKEPARRAAAEAALGKDGDKAAKEPGLRQYVTGIKLPMKAVLFIDGKKSLEKETVEMHFFNRLDDSVFGKPR